MMAPSENPLVEAACLVSHMYLFANVALFDIMHDSLSVSKQKNIYTIACIAILVGALFQPTFTEQWLFLIVLLLLWFELDSDHATAETRG